MSKQQIKQQELAKIRAFFHHKLNKGVCPVLKKVYYSDEMVVDHAHTANAKNLGKEDEAGLIRGVIHRQANTMEGKITNSFIRCGLHKFDITLPEFLRNLADFIENPPMTYLEYIHPNEEAKPKHLQKTGINKLVKLFKVKYPNKKLPEVLKYKKHKKGRKRGKIKEKKLTVGLERLFTEFEIEPKYKK